MLSAFDDTTHTLANINLNYKVIENFEVAGGVKNLLDQNYELA